MHKRARRRLPSWKRASGSRGPDAKLRIVVSIEREDAERLERISADRAVRPGAVIADLLREADRRAA
jgi:hypothetical protein